MPRFTIGSLLTGLVLTFLAVTVLERWRQGTTAAFAVDSGRISPPGGPTPLAVDPSRGTVAIGDEKANDYELMDSFAWDGGMDAATW